MGQNDLRNSRGSSSMSHFQSSKWCTAPRAHDYASKASMIPGKASAGRAQSILQQTDSVANIQKMKSQLEVENWADDEEFDDDKTFVHQRKPAPIPREEAPIRMTSDRGGRRHRDLRRVEIEDVKREDVYELDSMKASRSFNQFAANRKLTRWNDGMREYSDDLYTTPIPSGLSDEQKEWAIVKEKEILSSEAVSIHQRIERRRDFAGSGYDHLDDDTLYSTVQRTDDAFDSRPGVYVPPSKRSGDIRPHIEVDTRRGDDRRPAGSRKVPVLNMSKIVNSLHDSSADINDNKQTSLNPNAIAFLPPSCGFESDQKPYSRASYGEHRRDSLPKLSVKQLSREIASKLFALARVSKAQQKHSERYVKTQSTPESESLRGHPMQLRSKRSEHPLKGESHHSEHFGRKIGEKPYPSDELSEVASRGRGNHLPVPLVSPRGNVEMLSISPRSRTHAPTSSIQNTANFEHTQRRLNYPLHPPSRQPLAQKPQVSKSPQYSHFSPIAAPRDMRPSYGSHPIHHMDYADQESFHPHQPIGTRKPDIPNMLEQKLNIESPYDAPMQRRSASPIPHYREFIPYRSKPYEGPGGAYMGPPASQQKDSTASGVPPAPKNPESHHVKANIVFDMATNSIIVGGASNSDQQGDQSSLRFLADEAKETAQDEALLESPPLKQTIDIGRPTASPHPHTVNAATEPRPEEKKRDSPKEQPVQSASKSPASPHVDQDGDSVVEIDADHPETPVEGAYSPMKASQQHAQRFSFTQQKNFVDTSIEESARKNGFGINPRSIPRA